MVETSLHPRPCFYTFLRADSKEGDALTYYDFQRAQRSNKVEILQQKKARAYEPGYKKPFADHPAKLSRRVFQLKNKFVPPGYLDQSPSPVKVEGMKSLAETSVNEQLRRSQVIENVDSSTKPGPEASALESNSAALASSAVSYKEKSMENSTVQAQTERLPKISGKPRLVKSATARDHSSNSAVVSPPLIAPRPKTAASTRDAQVQTALAQEGHQRMLSEGSKTCIGNVDTTEREALCKSYKWGTATQRGFNDVKWTKRYSLPSEFLPTTTIEQFPDPVSQRLTFRRYNSEPAGWQTFGTQWDYFQTRRCDTFIKGPQAVDYCSSSRNIEQIPGYTGYLPGLGVFDEYKNIGIAPLTLVRTTQPRKTNISKRANIPGYKGQVHWTSTSPAHSDMPIPEPTSTARVHRYIPLEDELSPFRKEAVLARMVTTVSPYNPFNKIQH